MIRPYDNHCPTLRIYTVLFVRMLMPMIIMLIIDIRLVEIANPPFPCDRPEEVRNLLLLRLKKLTAEHEDRFDQAIRVVVLWCESLDDPLERLRELQEALVSSFAPQNLPKRNTLT